MGAWIVIHMARSQREAQRLSDKLTDEGILVKLKPVYKNKSEQENYYEKRAKSSWKKAFDTERTEWKC